MTVDMITTTEIGQRLGFMVSRSYLSDLGYPPDRRKGAKYLWYELRYPGICIAINIRLMRSARLWREDHSNRLQEVACGSSRAG